jgi:D-alanyl-D-alanine carboxypeptidase/D-alanyl-D-alanine-endopeptidase (penicillin-binding protein 4)
MSRLTRKPVVLLALALTLLQALPPCLADDATRRLSQRIGEIIHGPHYQHARWGILVVDAKTGQEIYSHNADMLCVPASVTKLFSVAAALFLLGVDFVFETPVYLRGRLTDGTLQGDLILVASGDLTMGGRTDAQGKMAFKDTDHIYAGGGGAELTDTDPLAGLKDLARQVKARGVRAVRGDVHIDDRLFDKSPSTGSGPTLVSPILINDNLVDILVTPGKKAGDPATVRMRPETSYVQMDAAVTTTYLGTRLEVQALGNERFTVRGQIALGSKPQVRIYPVADPAGFARALFIEVLQKEGVKVSASPLQIARPAALPERDSYAKMERVALHKSLPFSEAAKVTLKVSHNLYASTMPLLLAAKKGKRTLADGLKIQRQFLAAQGVDLDSVSFGGGGGPGDAAGGGTIAAGVGPPAGLPGVRGRLAGAGRGRHPGRRGRAEQPGAGPGAGQDRDLQLDRPAQRPHAADEQGPRRRNDHRARAATHLRYVRQRRAARAGYHGYPRGANPRPAVRDRL